MSSRKSAIVCRQVEAGRHVLGEEPVGLRGVLAVEREQRVAGEQLLDPLVVLAHTSSRARARRSLRMAASVRVFTVPTGMPRRSAIRVCVWPPKYASSITCRCSGGRIVEGLADLLASDVEVRALDDVLRNIFATNRLEVRGPLGSVAQALLAPDRVHGPVVDERQEEGPERPAGGVEGLGRSPEREEGVLDDLLRERLLAR